MERFDAGDKARLVQARDDFAEEATARELLSTAADGQGLSPSRLYAYARRREGTADLAIERRLRVNPMLRACYRRFVAAEARFYAPAAMAAATDEVPPRRGEGWRLTAARSQAEPGQYILIIELDGAPEPGVEILILCDRDQVFHHFAVPPPRRGAIQMILDADAEPIRLLRDPRTEAYLR